MYLLQLEAEKSRTENLQRLADTSVNNARHAVLLGQLVTGGLMERLQALTAKNTGKLTK